MNSNFANPQRRPRPGPGKGCPVAKRAAETASHVAKAARHARTKRSASKGMRWHSLSLAITNIIVNSLPFFAGLYEVQKPKVGGEVRYPIVV
jgi:hypothetical protein